MGWICLRWLPVRANLLYNLLKYFWQFCSRYLLYCCIDRLGLGYQDNFVDLSVLNESSTQFFPEIGNAVLTFASVWPKAHFDLKAPSYLGLDTCWNSGYKFANINSDSSPLNSNRITKAFASKDFSCVVSSNVWYSLNKARNRVVSAQSCNYRHRIVQNDDQI